MTPIFFMTPKVVDPICVWLDNITNGTGGALLTNIDFLSVIIRILLAIIMGGCIGLERAKKKHAAGLRTYILVCLGSTMVMMADQYLIEQFGTGDAARLGAAVLSGIGFLGAGTILFTSRGQIKGLTTAAGLWVAACLGICIGCGFYTVSILSFIIICLVLAFLPKFERYSVSKNGCFEIHIEFETRANLKSFIHLARENKLEIISVEHNPAYANSGLSVYTIVIVMNKDSKYKDRKEFIKEVSKLEYVDFVQEI